MRFRVRSSGSDAPWTEHEGDLAVGGIFFKAEERPSGSRYDIRFHLPGSDEELQVQGELIAYRQGAHVRFVDLDVRTELAIARYLDTLSK